MDQYRAVCGDCRDKAALHQIDQHWREAGLDYVAAEAPDDWLVQLACATNAARERSQVFEPQGYWKTSKENSEGMIVLQ